MKHKYRAALGYFIRESRKSYRINTGHYLRSTWYVQGVYDWSWDIVAEYFTHE